MYNWIGFDKDYSGNYFDRVKVILAGSKNKKVKIYEVWKLKKNGKLKIWYSLTQRFQQNCKIVT